MQKKTLSLTLAGLFLLFGSIFAWYEIKQYMIKKFFANYIPPPQAISTTIVAPRAWQAYLNAVGTINAKNSVDISPEVSGKIKQIFFHNGQLVKRGAALFQLDDTSEHAQKEDILAQLSLAEKNLARSTKLFQAHAVTQVALDAANTHAKQLQANLANINAILAKKLIRAPFDGKIGIRNIDLGQYVNAGFICTSLQAVNIYKVNFSLPQQDLAKIGLNLQIAVTSDIYPNQVFTGYISAIDSKVDSNTRTIAVEAAIDNSSKKLYSGMFVNLKILLPTLTNKIVLPQTAVTYTLYGDSVFVVNLNPKNQALGKVRRVFIKTADKQDNVVLISEGLKFGDIIVISGQEKLEDDTQIIINNSNIL